MSDAKYPLLNRGFECGPYGFSCEGSTKVRLCENTNLFGPTFLCPENTVCNEDSNDVCENTINHIDSSLGKTVRCRRNERIADPSVPGCKGYVLCIPNSNRFQGIKFKCSGTTIFNGITRSCSSPTKYKCPIADTTKASEFYDTNRRSDIDRGEFVPEDLSQAVHKPRPIDCKNYKFSVTQDGRPAKATFFCPSKPVPGERSTRCTVFSNNFCITLERLDEDQFALNTGIAYRRPRA